ncbi:MAG: ssDNA-binding protein, mitochondrial [Claussenomyces sp. TS43310]|nr:MAG: ssDNA-binding protein, mitochondrial [Claussenomyces sp. TS43310]
MFALRRSVVSSAPRAFSTTARASMAKINIIGNLAGPPTVEATSTGHEIIKYSVASNSGPKDNRQTSWFNVAAFTEEGPRRDFLTSLEKGTMVYVEGDAKMTVYSDKETGKNRQALSITQRIHSTLISVPTSAADESNSGSIEVLKRPVLSE